METLELAPELEPEPPEPEPDPLLPPLPPELEPVPPSAPPDEPPLEPLPPPSAPLSLPGVTYVELLEPPQACDVAQRLEAARNAAHWRIRYL